MLKSVTDYDERCRIFAALSKHCLSLSCILLHRENSVWGESVIQTL